MFTVIDIATGEALRPGPRRPPAWHLGRLAAPSDPALFDTRAEAEAWALEVLGADGVREVRIDEI